jgi:hypothetical protein
MHLAALPLLIAQGEGFGDFPWFIIVLALASALGALFKKKEPKAPPPHHRGGRRGPQVEHPPVPTTTPRSERPAPPTAPPPRPRPAEAGGRPPIIDIDEYDLTGRRRTPRRVPQARAAEPAKPVPATSAQQIRRLVVPQPAATTDAARADVTARLERLLRHRGDLQAGFVLAEILAPPLALRDQHRNEP